MLSPVQSIKRKVKWAYTRITLNTPTLVFFIIAFVHCLAQGIIQSSLFSVDASFTSLLNEIIQQTHPPATNFTFLQGDKKNGDFSHFKLHVCEDIPHGQRRADGADVCGVVFAAEDVDSFRSNSSKETTVLKGNTILHARTERNPANTSQITGVTLFLADHSGDHNSQNKQNSTSDLITDNASMGGIPVTLSMQCLQVLDYPRQLLNNARREDLTFIFLQFWLFGVSVVAILYDSIPHTLALLIARSLATAWSAYAIWRTRHNKHVFEVLFINPETPCGGIDFYPDYVKGRVGAEIPDLILNLTALFISGYLSWNLIKTYNQQTFKCMGPPTHIVKIYRFFMAVLICLHLATFFLVVAMGLWVDELTNTAIGKTSLHTPVYQACVIGTTVLLLPWVSMGWYAIRNEKKRMMTVFLITTFIFISAWSIMFYSIVYRWTLKEWPFFLGMTSYAFILLFASMVLGVICWFNFNKGLAHYLYAESALRSMDFVPSVFKHDPETASFDIGKQESGDSKTHIAESFYTNNYGSVEKDARSGNWDQDNVIHVGDLQGQPRHPVPTYYLPSLHSNQ